MSKCHYNFAFRARDKLLIILAIISVKEPNVELRFLSGDTRD